MTNERYLVAANSGCVRIYRESLPFGQRTPRLDLVEAFDLPAGRRAYTAAEADQAGRFPTSAGTGMSIDERLPMQEEAERRVAAQIGERVGAFLAAHPQVEWDFAAAPTLQKPVLERMPEPARQQLAHVIAKDLASLPPHQLHEHLVGR